MSHSRNFRAIDSVHRQTKRREIASTPPGIHRERRIHTYLTPANDVSVHRQHVHDFSLAFVAPLRAKDHRDLRYRTAARGRPLFLPRRDRGTVCLLHSRVYTGMSTIARTIRLAPVFPRKTRFFAHKFRPASTSPGNS